MFYQGTLQEGISTAVGQQKLVLCFVTSKIGPHLLRNEDADHPQMEMRRAKHGRMSLFRKNQ